MPTWRSSAGTWLGWRRPTTFPWGMRQHSSKAIAEDRARLVPLADSCQSSGSDAYGEGNAMDLLAEIDDRVRQRHLLGHPFYTSWVAGTLPREAMQEYARQYYAFESSFPRMLSALHARTDRADIRQALLENLWDEEHGEV